VCKTPTNLGESTGVIVYDIQNLTKFYPGRQAPANDNITLQIHQSEIFGLLGDNGAGKSTLVRQMVNLLRNSSGTVALFGRPVGQEPLHVPMNVGYMPQESHALNNLTVGEALYFTAHLRGLNRAQAQRERDRLLALWHMEHLRHHYSPRLSGGERRLLRLAVSMAGSPPVLVLDEPTNDLTLSGANWCGMCCGKQIRCNTRPLFLSPMMPSKRKR
jgi:ABC-type multidrug transport system ATPase subunit